MVGGYSPGPSCLATADTEPTAGELTRETSHEPKRERAPARGSAEQNAVPAAADAHPSRSSTEAGGPEEQAHLAPGREQRQSRGRRFVGWVGHGHVDGLEHGGVIVSVPTG